MRKLLFTGLLISSYAFANAQLNIGIHANAIIASQSISAQGISISGDSKFSWKAGLIGNIPISESISFMPQLNYINKGGKFGAQGQVVEFNLNYVELPLNFVYNTNGFFGGLGPVVSVGISGKGISNGVAEPTDLFSEAGGANRMEISGMLIAGYKIESGLFFNAHYNFGLSSVSPDAGGTGTLKNRYFGFGIGYFFRK